MKQVAGQLKLQLAQFSELQAFSQFASDLDEATQRQLARGIQIREFMKQAPGQPYTVLQQVALIYTGTRTNVLDGIGDLAAMKSSLLEAFGERSPWASVNVKSLTDIEEELRDEIDNVAVMVR